MEYTPRFDSFSLVIIRFACRLRHLTVREYIIVRFWLSNFDLFMLALMNFWRLWWLSYTELADYPYCGVLLVGKA